MGIFKNKSRKTFEPSRKQHRKENRKQKKLRKNEFFSKRRKPGQYVLNPENFIPENEDKVEKRPSHNKSKKCMKLKVSKIPTCEEIRKNDFKEHKKLQKQMIRQRNKQLLEANKEEDLIIRQLEKQLGLKKKKSKALPKSFVEEGLDYLLEICDPEQMKNAVVIEKELNDNDDFEEDFTLMTGKTKKKKVEESDDELCDNEDDNNYSENESNDDLLDDEDIEDDDNLFVHNKYPSEEDQEANFTSEEDNEQPIQTNEEVQQHKSTDKAKANKRKSKSNKKSSIKKQKTVKKIIEDFSENENSEESVKYSDCELPSDEEEEKGKTSKTIKGAVKVKEDGTWEDIYGRLRGNNGSILASKKESKYVPPAIREKLCSDAQNGKDSEKVIRLRRQLKGLLNRLAESNMHSIATQIEELYMNNSRNDMNHTLTNLLLDSLVTEIITPERLLIEHMLLISILHANVGAEVGAHFLQTIIKKFDQFFESHRDVGNKILDNVILIIAQLYNFKIFDSKLMYDILRKLAEDSEEKCIECILHVLRSVGFILRKDDPLALKNLITDLQKKAAAVSAEDKGYSRVKFMLEILLAIKNNNVTKIPNYDVSYSEHLKKVMKGLIRKGNYITQLNISLEDLLKADERGRWWVVGSAWSGNDQSIENNDKNDKQTEKYSNKLLGLAKKQRMNTETRRNVFCVIMSAEDYLDAFEKLLKLGLKNQQEREIINVILHCCLQEKQYNPYYAHLAQKFCDFERKYQLNIKYTVWDKLKALNEHSGYQISNLAKLLIHLFVEKGLPISTLKIVQFSDLNKITLRFMRQVLIGIILHEEFESCLSIFAKVSVSAKLKMFRESLRLFIHHFILKNLKTESIPDDQLSLLEERAKLVENVLALKEHKI